MVKTTKQGCPSSKRRHFGGSAAIRSTAIVVLLIACTSLFVLPSYSIEYLPNKNLPVVTYPNELFYNSDTITDTGDIGGVWFQSERGNNRVFLTQPIEDWWQDGIDAKYITDIPESLRTTLYNGGWFSSPISEQDQLGRFQGDVQVDGLDYIRFNMGISLDNIPMYADYVNFEIYLLANNCYWIDGTLDPVATKTPLRFDSSGNTYIAMGYWSGNYFINCGTTTVVRSGNWIRIKCRVSSGELYNITSLQVGLNSYPANQIYSRNGSVHLDFYVSPLVAYSDIYGGITRDEANSWLYGAIMTPTDDYDDPYDDYRPSVDEYRNVSDYMNGGLDAISAYSNGMVAFSSVVNDTTYYIPILSTMVAVGLMVTIGKKVLAT